MAGYTSAYLEARDKLIFNNETFAALSGVSTFYLSAHTADPAPGGVGDQDNSEVTYTPYARVGVPRSAAGLIISGGLITLASVALFAKGTAGGGVATFIGLGTASSGAGFLIFSAPLDIPWPLGVNAQPQLDDDSFWRHVLGA